MNKFTISAGIALAFVCASATLHAGQQLRFYFRGSSTETNEIGKMIVRPLSEKTWLQDYARAAGVSDLNSIAVVYNVKGNPMGDTVDIVNVESGQVLTSLIGFYFGQDFGRQWLVSGDGLTLRRLDYIYTRQNSHSLGSALITQRYILDRFGNTNRVSYQGPLQYIVTRENGASLKMISGTFSTGKALQNPRSTP